MNAAAPDPHIDAPPLVPLEAALARLAREATHGVFDTGRYRCRYYSWGKGEGPPLVFIHGLIEQARSYALVIALLSQHFRCVAYELPTGDGDGARLGGYRHPHLVADFFALLDHLAISTADVFASSFGSTIALAAMLDRPGRIGRAVLQGGFARRPLSPPERRLAQFARYWPGRMRHLPFRRPMLRATQGDAFRHVPPSHFEFLLANSGDRPIPAAAYPALILDKVNLVRRLPEIRQPVLMICGDRDFLVPPRFERPLVERLPLVERVEIAGCGHLPQYTHPALVATLVRRFLTPRDGFRYAAQ